ALAWYPAFVVADVVERGDGFGVVYVAAVAWTSAIAGLFVLLAGLRVAGSTRSAVIAAIAIWLGSPLAFYSLRHATMSHAISAAACAAVVLLCRNSPNAFAIGMSLGFACAVRPQNITIALVPFILVPGFLRKAHIALAGAVLAALPELIVSQVLWGAPFAFVNIGGRAHPWQMFATFRPFETIFSWYHGLATWTPLLVLAIAGLFLLKDRRLALAGLVTFASQWLVLAALERWFWGGASFGQRRFDSCTIFFILGLAALLERLPRWLGYLLTLACTSWTMLLFIAAQRLNLNQYQTPRELLDAFRSADSAWHSFLGYTPPQLRMGVLLGILLATLTAVLVAILARRWGTILAATYLALMSAFFVWCGLHPKFDDATRALIARPMRSGSAMDTQTLLLYEAAYMERTGRPTEAARARAEAAAIRP
ncbi:MAG: hypothetical protein ACLGH0_01765, partial [Thermoanaerobaculia bacterium]